ncbi:tRNA(Ile)-lysidine synthase [Acanthocystis turfacea Chlorella virus OR0704.3]|nr:tRNA(Ile)-lysidine synthase [Acanthocystis turfacea Chlorella virus OR0704.3]
MDAVREFVNEFLDNEEFWFSQSDDTDNILRRHEDALNFSLDAGFISNADLANLVITFDQLPRHVFRHTQSNHIIEYFLNIALSFFDRLNVEKIRDDVVFCFVHLPLRHTKNPVWIRHAAKSVWARATPGCHEIVHRFLKASYERCPTADQSPFIHEVFNDVIFDAQKHAHTTFFTPDDYALPVDRNNHVVKEVEAALKKVSPSEITMSISGGVDSMTLFHILSGLRNVYGYELRVAMVNYTNRACAYDEETFVADWVNWNGHVLNIRRIDEINRKPCVDLGMRTTYETFTRNVRYGVYKTIARDAYVAMGHNKDDVLENIFQNVAMETKYENLSGMDTVVEQDGIKFFRPLLGVTKDDIVEYARSHNIPFLPNSTPPHFMRGQIRNTIVPTMNAWNDRFIPGLFKLKDTVAELSDAMDVLTDGFVKSFEQNSALVDPKYVGMKTMFWRSALKKLFPGETFRARMFDSFMDSLAGFETEMKFVLNKNVLMKMTKKKNGISIRFVI